MANILTTQDLTQNITLSSINTSLKIYRAEPSSAELIITYSEGSLTNNYPPSFLSTSFNGVVSTSFKDDFYYKIRYLPVSLNVGSLTSKQSRELYVFNGFFEDKTLENLLLTNNEGITINGPSTPSIYKPLQLSLYDISIDVDGPATIDANITFDWETPLVDFTIRVFGSRSIAIPYLFQPGTVENLDWKTQVLTSDNGSEKRIRLRNSPRQSFNISLNTPNGSHITLDNILYAWRGNIFALPVSTETRKSLSATATNSSVINVNTDYANFRVGGIAIVYYSSILFEIFQIESFTQNQMIADRDFSKVIPVGSLVMPAISAKLNGPPKRILNGYSAALQAEFTSISNNTLETVASNVQYKGVDVLTDEVYLQGDLATDSYERDVVNLDYQTGLQEVFNPWENTKINRSITVWMDSLEEVWDFKLWLHRRAGKLIPFYTPTFENDFDIVNTGVIGATFNVIDEGQLTLTGNRLSIAVSTKQGWQFADIVPPITQNGNYLSITLNSAINLDRTQINYMSYFDRKRLSADNIDITWHGNFKASSTFNIVTTE